MGDASDPQNPNFALSGFDAALWDKINALIKQYFFTQWRRDFSQ